MSSANQNRTKQACSNVLEDARVIKAAMQRIEAVYLDQTRGQFDVNVISDGPLFAENLNIGDLSYINDFIQEIHDQYTNRLGDRLAALV
jgi:hypothetical protein